MTAISRLANLLISTSQVDERLFRADRGIDEAITKLRRIVNSSNTDFPKDVQMLAIVRFWKSLQLESLRDARYVCYGLGAQVPSSKSSIMENRERFCAVLDKKTGVDQWVENPRWYRRCYQGLVHSYFMYDTHKEDATAVGRRNWEELRDYLHDRASCIAAPSYNPSWVNTALENRAVFSQSPCQPYAESVLNGDTSIVDNLHEHLNFDRASWFDRELILSQIQQAILAGDDRFVSLIPILLKLLEDNPVLRDRGLILVLDRYAAISSPPVHPDLRDKAVQWWRNPWLQSNQMRWGGVTPAARAMVGDWLKQEFIESFFTKLSQDGLADRRRVNFWLRYVKSMSAIEFALGDSSRLSRNSDFVLLRQKMEGLYTELRGNDSDNNAFIMTMKNLVAVEFSSQSNALYGYDKRQQLPFTLSKPVVSPVNAPNSLKHSRRVLWLSHQDNVKGFDRWEQRFENELQNEFGVLPDERGRTAITTARSSSVAPKNTSAPMPSTHSPGNTSTPLPKQVPASQKSHPTGAQHYSREGLNDLARSKGFELRDLTGKNRSYCNPACSRACSKSSSTITAFASSPSAAYGLSLIPSEAETVGNHACRNSIH